jgi:oligopeptidase A
LIIGVNNITWDTVELPSQFMENWVYDKKTVQSFAKHHITGEPLPAELFAKMKAARNFQAGRQLLHQLYLGALDLTLHSAYDPLGKHASLTPEQFLHNNDNDNDHDHSLSQFLMLPANPDDHTLCSFGHIFGGGYAAGYYSYIWAEVMSADAFAAFEEAGLEDEAAVRAAGLRFRETVLARGGECSPAEVFRDFRGRDADPAALLRHRGL